MFSGTSTRRRRVSDRGQGGREAEGLGAQLDRTDGRGVGGEPKCNAERFRSRSICWIRLLALVANVRHVRQPRRR